MTVTDAFLLAKSQNNNATLETMKVCKFADNLAWDLIHNQYRSVVPCNYIPSSSATSIDIITCHQVNNIVINECITPTSAITCDTEEEHKLDKWDKWQQNGEKRRLRRKCKICKIKKTQFICMHPKCKDQEINVCSNKCLESHKVMAFNTNV